MRFEFYSIEPMTQQEALLIQTNHGYNPADFDANSFTCIQITTRNKREYYRIQWLCNIAAPIASAP